MFQQMQQIPKGYSNTRQRAGLKVRGWGLLTLMAVGIGLSLRISNAAPAIPPATPSLSAATPNTTLPGSAFSVEETMARAIARTELGLPGGIVLATWADLARKGGDRERFSTRFLGERQKTFTSYPDFIKKFSRTTTDPEVAAGRVLLLSVHAAHGLGFQVASDDINEMKIPAEIDFDMYYSPLEFVSMGRVRADLGNKYSLIVLGQCQPRACLRFQDGDIPIGKELFKQIKRLSGAEKQLSIVRNPRENVFLAGTKVVYRQPYSPPADAGTLAKVVTPDLIGAQVVHRQALESTMTDVWVLSGKWSDQPSSRYHDRPIYASKEMVALADKRVQAAREAERQEAAARGIALPAPAAAAASRQGKDGG
jgi:hypothetical protein